MSDVGESDMAAITGLGVLPAEAVSTHNIDPELLKVLGPARLAFCTPVHEAGILADRKAAFLLTACGLMLTILFFFIPEVVQVRQSRPLLGGSMLAMLAVLLVLVLLSAVSAYLGYVAPMPELPESLVHYQSVGRRGGDDYRQQMKDLSHSRALLEMLQYNHAVARQSMLKFRRVNHTLRCFHIVIPLWMLLLLVIAATGS